MQHAHQPGCVDVGGAEPHPSGETDVSQDGPPGGIRASSDIQVVGKEPK